MGCGGSKVSDQELSAYGFPTEVFNPQNPDEKITDKVVMSAIGSVDIPDVTIQDVLQTICHFDGTKHKGIFMEKWEHNHKSAPGDKNKHNLGLFRANDLKVKAQVQRSTPPCGMGKLIMDIDMEVIEVWKYDWIDGKKTWSRFELDPESEEPYNMYITFGFDLKAKAANKNVEFDAQMWRFIEESDTGVKISDCMMCTRRQGMVMKIKGNQLMKSQINGRMEAFKNAVEDYKAGEGKYVDGKYEGKYATYTDESTKIVTDWIEKSTYNFEPADPAPYLNPPA